MEKDAKEGIVWPFYTDEELGDGSYDVNSSILGTHRSHIRPHILENGDHLETGNDVFASYQNKKGKDILKKFNFDPNDLKTWILVENEKTIYTKSDAILKVLLTLDGFWPFLYPFILIPKSFRDFLYDQIAKNRIKWFGTAECMVVKNKLERFPFD